MSVVIFMRIILMFGLGLIVDLIVLRETYPICESHGRDFHIISAILGEAYTCLHNDVGRRVPIGTIDDFLHIVNLLD
jgi:hypothetical protein